VSISTQYDGKRRGGDQTIDEMRRAMMDEEEPIEPNIERLEIYNQLLPG
jgi:hypothetical protein